MEEAEEGWGSVEELWRGREGEEEGEELIRVGDSSRRLLCNPTDRL